MKRLMGEAGMLARFGGVGAIATLVHLSVAAIAFILFWPIYWHLWSLFRSLFGDIDALLFVRMVVHIDSFY